MKILYHIGITISILMGIIAIGLSTPILSHDFALATSEKPEPYTELYFNNLLSLPPSIKSGKQQNLNYTIANHEGRLNAYTYHVLILEDSVVKTVINKTVAIDSEQSVSLPITFIATKSRATIEVIVELPEQHQSIHFRTAS